MKNELITVDLDKFHRIPARERRTTASNLLGAFGDMYKALVQDPPHNAGLDELLAYVRVKTQIEEAILFWRREMQRAAWESKNIKSYAGAGRRPAIKAHGCAAVASLAGSLSDALSRSGNAGKVAT